MAIGMEREIRMKQFVNARNLLIVWTAGFAVSFVMQSVLQVWFADNSYWGPNRGWQNEIAIWNVGILAILFSILSGARGHERRVLPGLALLSACFAINHMNALIAAPGHVSHVLGALGNGIGVVLYLLYLWIWRRQGNG